jgi:hypothetical protein
MPDEHQRQAGVAQGMGQHQLVLAGLDAREAQHDVAQPMWRRKASGSAAP